MAVQKNELDASESKGLSPTDESGSVAGPAVFMTNQANFLKNI
jgi:hypothetical protein